MFISRTLILIITLFTLYSRAQTTFQRTYGSIYTDVAEDIIESSNGSYVVAGYNALPASQSPFLMEIDCQGNILWINTLVENSGKIGHGYDVIKTFDGGYLLAGKTGTFGLGSSEAFLLKVASNGAMQWFNTYGTSDFEYIEAVVQTSDSGFVALGKEGSSATNLFLFKTEKNGNLIWSKSIDAGGNESGYSLILRPNGDLIAFGTSDSKNILAVKSDINGNIIWIRTYEITNSNLVARDAVNTKDGGYIVCADISLFLTGGDYCAVKFDANDNVEWAKSFDKIPDNKLEKSNAIIQTKDGGYAIAGMNYYDFQGNLDYSLLKIDELGNAEWGYSYGDANGPSATNRAQSLIQAPDKGFLIAGYYNLSDIGIIKTDDIGKSGCNETAFILRDSSLIFQMTNFPINSSNYGTQSSPAPVINTTKLTRKNVCAPTPIPLKINGDTLICPGDSAVLTANVGESFVWSTTETTQSIKVAPTAATTYTVNVSYPCYGPATATITVDLVVSTLTVSISATASNICSGDSLVLTANSNGNNYSWDNGSTSQSIVVKPTVPTTYTVIASSSCSSPASATIAIGVTNTPTVSISAGSTDICLGDSIILSGNSNYNNYSWSTGSTDPNIKVAPTTPTTYTLISYNGTCPATDTLTINVLSMPVALISGDSNLCPNESIVLTASSAGTYLWNTGESTPSITVAPVINTVYSVTLANGTCEDADSISVTVNPAATGSAGTDTLISLGESVTLFAAGGGTYLWSPSIGLSCNNCPNPVASPLVTTQYYVTITDSNGCTTLDSVLVEVNLECKEIFLPNAFSPNNDGQNDELKIYGSSCIKTLLLVIYNRWGEKVYETTNPSDAWDGTFRGKALDTGVFTYYLNAELFDSRVVERRGNIYLMR